MRILIHLSYILFFFILDYSCLYPQQQLYTIKDTIPVQYRRGVEVPSGFQSYEQKYQGKDLQEEKRRLYPLDKVKSGTGVWTELNPKVPRVDYLGIHFVNVDTGWACGDLGTIIKTTDGGTNWVTEETNTTTPMLKVNSFDGHTVIATGFSGLILRSTNGGDSWSQMTSGVIGDLWGLQMINDTLGWACGTGNSLIKTTDAGITWQTVTTPGYTGNKWWLDFLNENYGFIAGDGKVLRTTDGGNSWDIIQAGDNQPLYSVDVIDSLHIAAAGYGGTSYRGKTIYSSDGGNNWITGGQTTFDPINCIKYINPDTGYITMSEVGLWKTTNAGQNWRLLDSIPLTNIGEFEIQLFPYENVGYDVGSSLKIYKSDGNLDTWHKLIINDDFTDVFLTNEQKGFVLSDGLYSKLFKTTDGGINWDTVPGVPGGNCITFTDSLTGYYGTTASQIYKTTNGGGSWYPTTGIITRIAKIFFIYNQIGWAVGESRIYKTTDSGENWFEQVVRPGGSFTSIYFIDSLYGWSSVAGWRPYKTTDGGENWIEQTNLDFWNQSDVYFANQDAGWMINDYTGSVLYRTNDGGVSWDTVAEVLGPYKFNYFPNHSHWIINGFRVYITTDSGYGWNDITNDVPAGFNNFQASTDFVGYAAGPGGLILKYNDTTFTPVELVSFNGKLDKDKVMLTWITASELNNYGFYIERSYDKIKWDEIGFVKGGGTSTKREYYKYVDLQLAAKTTFYRLKQQDFSGKTKYSNTISIEANNLPLKLRLYQNFPNPFNPITKIIYEIPREEFVQLKVFNILGEEVSVLVNKKQEAGKYEIEFPMGLVNLPSGVYIYQLKSGEKIISRKMILIK